MVIACGFLLTNTSFGMKPEEASSNQYINFNKLEKRRLEEQNNRLLQENNKLLCIIIKQNQLISLSGRPFCCGVNTVEACCYRKLDALYKEFENNYKS